MHKENFFVLLSWFIVALTRGDAPTSSHYSGYTIPSSKGVYSQYSVPSSQYGGSTVKGGYSKASTAKASSSYGVPSSSYDSSAIPSASYGSPAPPSSSYGSTAQSDGLESLRDFATAPDSAFIQRRLFNTSVALTVPLFSFTLPQRASQGSTVDLANQAIFGLFSLLVVVLVFAVPILFTGSRPTFTGRSNDNSGTLTNLMGSAKVFNFMGADFTNNIGLDSSKCLQKTICEAHKYPKKYGLMAQPFLIFFPPPAKNTSNAKASIFQLAALDGKGRKDCGKQYKCFFDILDLCDYFMDWWKYSTSDNIILDA